MSVRELYNSLLSDPNDSGFKDARDEDDNIIISDSKLCSLFPLQLKQIKTQIHESGYYPVDQGGKKGIQK